MGKLQLVARDRYGPKERLTAAAGAERIREFARHCADRRLRGGDRLDWQSGAGSEGWGP